MSYALGIDLGTTYTAAAIARNGRAEVAALGYRATSVPAGGLLTGGGRVLVGGAAGRPGHVGAVGGAADRGRPVPGGRRRRAARCPRTQPGGPRVQAPGRRL